MPSDIRGWSLSVGDKVAFAVKPGKLVLGTVIPLAVEPHVEAAARELYVRLEGPTGRVLKSCKQVAKVGGE